jgi:hypothetical protein
MRNIVFETQVEYPIKLIQTGIDSFTVVYGQQVTKGLSYVEAAKELGCCIMHGATCQGKIESNLELLTA